MLASMKDRLERVAICQACEQYRKPTKQCKECGCLVSLKVSWADTACPLGKWSEVPGGFDPITQMQQRMVRFFKQPNNNNTG